MSVGERAQALEPEAGGTVRATHLRMLAILWLVCGLLLVLTWMGVHSLIEEDRARVLGAAERDLSNLTRVSQEHASRTLRSADQVIRFVQSRYLEVGTRLDLRELSAKGVIDTQIFNQVGVIDAQGLYILSNLPNQQKVDLSDRAHFKVHVASDSGELFISEPVLGRASGKWSIQLSRRISRPDGSFAGVVVVSIDPGYFTRFYADLDLGAQGLAALYGMDGVARARIVGNVSDFGARADKSPLFGMIEAGQLQGTLRQKSVVDGVERQYFYRKLPGFPLVVLAGTELQFLMAGHSQARQGMLQQAIFLSLLLLFLGVSLTYYLGQLQRETARRRLAQQQSQERARQLQAIFAMSPDGLVSFDENRRIQYVNPSFGRMTDTPPESLQGLDEFDFSAWLAARCRPEAAFQGVARMRSSAAEQGSAPQQILEMASSPKRVLKVSLLQGQTQAVPLILYLRDITQEREVDRMKSEFLSIAAHELRTPMASIYGFVEVLLDDGGLSPTQTEYLEIVFRQSQLMVHILNDLLDLARIESRRDSDFQYSPVDLPKLLRSVIQAWRLPPGRSGPVLRLSGDSIVVSADEGKLRQVVVNILSNAYKFSPEGGDVTIDLDVQTVDGVPMVCLQVSDCGIGMSPQQLAQVFARFYRADASGKISGTGLGMSIVKEIVDLHRGRITLHSEVGQGTRVSVFLPLVAAPSRSLPSPLQA